MFNGRVGFLGRIGSGLWGLGFGCSWVLVVLVLKCFGPDLRFLDLACI